VHYLLGLATSRSNRFPEAESHFTNGLQENPLFWSCFEELAKLGTNDSKSWFSLPKIQEKEKLKTLSKKRAREQDTDLVVFYSHILNA
jgi:hypothetical protein